jgi:peptidoglycan/xylan/chitin deacetylase (PgdA/CDA1 family)
MLASTNLTNRATVQQSFLPLIAAAQSKRRNWPYNVIKSMACDDSGDWSVVNGTVSNDTDNYLCGMDNKQSVKLQVSDTATAGFMNYDFGSGQDLTDGDSKPPFVKLRFYVHQGSDDSSYENISSLALYLNDAGGSWSDFFAASFQDNTPRWAGWHTVILSPSHFSTTGSPSWSNIDIVRVRINTADTSHTPSVTIDQIEFIARPSKAYYCFTFDDGYEDHYEMAAYLTSRGMCGTFFIIPVGIGNSGRLTLEQLHKMHDAGHTIANHGWLSLGWNTEDRSLNEMVTDITKAAEWLAANGFGDGARLWAVPGGTAAWKPQGIYQLLGKYLDQVRLTSPRITTTKSIVPYRTDLLNTGPFDSISDADTALNNVSSDTGDNGLVISGWHGFDSFTQSEFQTHVDNVAAKRNSSHIDIVTVADLLIDGIV